MGSTQVDMSSDLKVMQLLQRRGIAVDIAGIMTFMLLLPLPSLSNVQKQKQFPASSSGETPSSAMTSRQPKKRARSGQPKAAPKKEMRAPASIGGSAMASDGSRICFAFNEGSCLTKGAGCQRGKHVCTKCFGQFPSSQGKNFQWRLSQERPLEGAGVVLPVHVSNSLDRVAVDQGKQPGSEPWNENEEVLPRHAASGALSQQPKGKRQTVYHS